MEKRQKQPKAFYMIFFLEFWERFGFCGFNAVLSFFFVQSLGYSQPEAFATFGAFSSILCALIAIGGFIGDKVLGTKRTIVLGALVLMIGYFMLAFSNPQTVFYALGAICTGNGLFKANPSSLLSKFYAKDDPRLHSAFTMYYMAINLGGLVAVLIIPGIAASYGWNIAFLISGVGLIVALVNFFMMKKHVNNVDSIPGEHPVKIERLILVIIGSVACAWFCAYLLRHISIAHIVLWALCIGVTMIFFKYLFQEHGISRRKMLVAFVLMLEAIIFYTLYQQMPTSLNFFAINNVNCHFLGIDFNPQSFQFLNCFWIVVMSPILAFLYNHYGSKKKDMSLAGKFALGMTLCAISFSLLYFSRFFSIAGIVSAWWLVATYFFQSTGELLISALGLAMVAELVPRKIVGFIMGMWFLTIAIAGVTGGYVATLTSPPIGITGAVNTLQIYTNVFLQIGLATFVIAAVMWATSPLLNKYLCTKEK